MASKDSEVDALFKLALPEFTAARNALASKLQKAGDKAALTARLKAAKKEGLYASVIKGKGAMPPKGGNAALSDDAVKAAVDHLLATAK